MRRIVMALASVIAFALAAPGVALAHHHGHAFGPGRHGRHRGLHHARGARVIRFTPAEEGKGASTTTSKEGGTEPESVGTVASFENEVLTIKLSDGSTVSGKVTEDTRLVCISSTSSQPDDDQGAGDDQSADGEGNSGGDEGSTEDPSGEGGEHGGQSAHDSSFDEGGWNNGEDDDQGSIQACETTALVQGATVREAELRLTSSGAIWESVVLIH